MTETATFFKEKYQELMRDHDHLTKTYRKLLIHSVDQQRQIAELNKTVDSAILYFGKK